MIRERIASVFRRVRQSGANSPLAVNILCATALLILGARVPIPGIDSQALADYFRIDGAKPLLRLFDWFVGGALSRGAVLALGLMPYISARIYLRLARTAFPAVGRLAREPGGMERLARWAPRLSLVLAVAESIGFARFVQTVPGAVANPGAIFIVQTVVVLTAGAMTVTWLAERARRGRSRQQSDLVDFSDEANQEVRPVHDTPLLSPANVLEEPIRVRPSEKVAVK